MEPTQSNTCQAGGLSNVYGPEEKATILPNKGEASKETKQSKNETSTPNKAKKVDSIDATL